MTNRTVFIDQHQDIRSDIFNSRSTTRDDHNILVYNNNFIDDIISEHPELTANYASYYNPDDLNDGLDVLFNIRGADLNPLETMEWIYNGEHGLESGQVILTQFKIGVLFLGT